MNIFVCLFAGDLLRFQDRILRVYVFELGEKKRRKEKGRRRKRRKEEREEVKQQE